MKKFIALGFTAIFIVFSVFSSSFAAISDNPGQTDISTGKKAERGIKNIVFGWTELPKMIWDKTRETDPVTGLLAATWQGVVKSFARTASGIADLATFPLGGSDKPAIPKALEQ